MKQFGKIFRFEIKGYLKNKIFVGSTIFLVVVLAVVMFIPNIKSAFQSDSTKEKPVMIVYAEDERQAGFRLLAGKYAPELTEEALDTYIKSCAEEATVVRIEVEYIAGKANRGAAMG